MNGRQRVRCDVQPRAHRTRAGGAPRAVEHAHRGVMELTVRYIFQRHRGNSRPSALDLGARHYVICSRAGPPAEFCAHDATALI